MSIQTLHKLEAELKWSHERIDALEAEREQLLARIDDTDSACADYAFAGAHTAREIIEKLHDRIRGYKTDRDLLAEANDQLRAELETERMRLVACSVIALANTTESAASARDMHPDYQSPCCDDVARAVDREIALRAELAECKNALASCIEALTWEAGGEPLPDMSIRARSIAINALREGVEK